MSKQQETLRLALEALETSLYPQQKQLQAITAIREALALSESSTKCEETSHAQPDVDRRSTESKETFDQQEPVAITITGKLGNIYSFTGDYSLKKGDKVYTTPPQRTWVGLTDEELGKVLGFQEYTTASTKVTLTALSRAVEAKLKEKNT